MNRIYDEIMQMIGADEFKELIKKWEVLSSNIQRDPQELPILLPNLFCVGNSGIGRTKLMRLMSEYLSSKGNLMDFYGDVKYFEFLLGYVHKDAHFTELQRLEDELAVARGFRNEFRGAILIDIDPWVDHYQELYFVSFMEYLSAHNDKWMIVLSVSEQPEEKLNDLEAFLSMYLRLDKITLSLPKTEDLCSWVASKLKEYGLSVDKDARQLLIETIDELRQNPYFDGFKTIKMLSQEIVYEHFSGANARQKVLKAEDLAEFAAGSSYVKKVKNNSAKMHRIGFVSGEE